MVKNFIAGESVDGGGRARYDLVDPATGEKYAEAPRSRPEDVEHAFRVAQDAFDAWSTTTPSQRSLAMLRFADALEARTDELVDIECRNTGKPRGLTTSEEIPPMLDQIRFFAGACRVLEGRSAGEYMEGFTSFVRREPVGVCAQITPWNYPMMMAVWKFAPAIAAGNTVVLKPAHTTPASTAFMAEVAAEFLPPGVLNVVCGHNAEMGAALLDSPVPRMVSITGQRAGRTGDRPGGGGGRQAGPSRAGREGAGHRVRRRRRRDDRRGHRAGRVLQRRAGLHGRHPGARPARGSTTTWSPRLTEAAGRRKLGGPDDAGADVGPLNSAAQLERVSGFIDRLPEHAAIRTGGIADGAIGGSSSSRRWCPGSQQSDEIVQNEVFGPVITVQRVQRRGRGCAMGQRRRVRTGVVGVDQGPRSCDAYVGTSRLRLRVDQHAHPARGRDAPRRVQALRLREGSLGLRLRGLHEDQARHELHRLVEPLNDLTPGDHDKRSFLVNSGAEAVDNAVKVARCATGRSKVAAFDHGFHGSTLLTMRSLTGKVDPYRLGFGPFAPEIYRASYSDPFWGTGRLDEVTRLLETTVGAETIACVVVEPIAGEGKTTSSRMPEPDWSPVTVRVPDLRPVRQQGTQEVPHGDHGHHLVFEVHQRQMANVTLQHFVGGVIEGVPGPSGDE